MMSNLHRNVIRLLAEKNMRVSDVARKIKMTRSQVETAMQQIKRETGLDPQNFFDLHELYQMATNEVSE